MEQITLLCDECEKNFQIDLGIGLAMLAFAEGNDDNRGDPIVCPDCCLSAQWAREEYGDSDEVSL